MTRRRRFLVGSALAGLVLSLGGVALAQQIGDYTDPLEPLPAPTTEPVVDPGVPTDPAPLPDGTQPPANPEVDPVPPEWTYEQTQSNTAGTVTNTHRYMADEQGVPYLREHAVTNPRGEMLQTWEHTQTEEGGYLDRRSHTFTAPDGTILRQQEWTRSGTDPYNTTRQHEMTLRDGRTISHTQTRTFDGTTGTMEKTFVGPNGQTRQMTRPWTPDDVVIDPTAPTPDPQPTPDPTPVPEPAPTDATALSAAPAPDGTTAAAPPAEEPSKWGWLKRLNPFDKSHRPTAGQAGSAPRRGFTVGSGRGHSQRPQVPHGLANREPGQPSPNSHRPATAGRPDSPGHSASHPTPPGHSRSR